MEDQTIDSEAKKLIATLSEVAEYTIYSVEINQMLEDSTSMNSLPELHWYFWQSTFGCWQLKGELDFIVDGHQYIYYIDQVEPPAEIVKGKLQGITTRSKNRLIWYLYQIYLNCILEKYHRYPAPGKEEDVFHRMIESESTCHESIYYALRIELPQEIKNQGDYYGYTIVSKFESLRWHLASNVTSKEIEVIQGIQLQTIHDAFDHITQEIPIYFRMLGNHERDWDREGAYWAIVFRELIREVYNTYPRGEDGEFISALKPLLIELKEQASSIIFNNLQTRLKLLKKKKVIEDRVQKEIAILIESGVEVPQEFHL